MEELPGFNRLGHHMIEVEPGHLFVSDLRIDTDHVRMVERGDETEHRAGCRQVNITTRFIRFSLERKAIVVTLVDRVFTQEVERFAIPLQRFTRIFCSIHFSALASTPENVDMRT